MTGAVLGLYNDRLSLGEIEEDVAQQTAVVRLDELAANLSSWRPFRPGLFSAFLGTRAPAPRGLYIHGGVGRGKTMLMDLFFDAVGFSLRRRLHFHEFMAEVHDRLARARGTAGGDPIPAVAAGIAVKAGLLCLDELHVTDIADAMILARLFRALFEHDVVVVATSNVPPERLYWNGLNRPLFLPFVGLIGERLAVIELEAAKDYRLDKLSGRQLYFSPCDEAARAGLDDHWQRLTGHHPGAPTVLELKGRKVHVPLASMGVARFSFADLCAKPLGALDYLHIAHAFHTVIVEGISALTPSRRNEARRLVNLVDVLYDNRVCLIASAEVEPDLIYRAGDGVSLFARTASRLHEMRSEAYLCGRSARAGVLPAMQV